MIRLALLLWACVCLPAAAQDQFFYNATGYTMRDSQFTTFDALIVRDGRVQAAGPEALLRPYAEGLPARDLGGASIMPGFVNAHAQLSLDGCKEETRKACLLKRLRNIASFGLTMVLDSNITQETWDDLSSLRDDGNLPIRVHAAIDGLGENYDALSTDGPIIGTYKGLLTLRAVRLVSAPLKRDQTSAYYELQSVWDAINCLNCCVYPDQEEADPVAQRNRIARGMMRGYQMRIAASGDTAVRRALEAFGDVAEIAGTQRRHQLVVAGMPPADIAGKFASTGTIAIVSPCIGAYAVRAPYGYMEREEGILKRHKTEFNALREANVRLAMSSPSTIATLEAFFDVEDPNSATFRAAFEALTLGGAYAAFADHHLGSLETGKWADFVVLSGDFMKDPGNTGVMETWVAGKRVFSRN